VRGVPPVALRYRVEGDSVLCEDVATGQTTAVQPGDRRQLGKVLITVCSATSTQQSGYTLKLKGGKVLALHVGMPLTADDLPGVQPRGDDGVVALVSPRPLDPKVLFLRNRSKQTWTITRDSGKPQHIEPGSGVELSSGLHIDFGGVQGQLTVKA
jgi:hypothetical protein